MNWYGLCALLVTLEGMSRNGYSMPPLQRLSPRTCPSFWTGFQNRNNKETASFSPVKWIVNRKQSKVIKKKKKEIYVQFPYTLFFSVCNSHPPFLSSSFFHSGKRDLTCICLHRWLIGTPLVYFFPASSHYSYCKIFGSPHGWMPLWPRSATPPALYARLVLKENNKLRFLMNVMALGG